MDREYMEKEPIFSRGSIPSLEKILKSREGRVSLQEKLLRSYPGFSLLAFKLNIPGPVKNNGAIKRIFDLGVQDIGHAVEGLGCQPYYKKEVSLETGPELFLVIPLPALALKASMVELEESLPLGRLYDIDVLTESGGEVSGVARVDAGYLKRRCFICEEDAKACGRSRAHSVPEMLERMEEMTKKERRLMI